MKKEKRLDRKIHRLFRQAGHPRWAHQFGPKKFQTWVLCLGLVIKQIYQLSYRRAMRFLDDYYGIEMHWTTLQKAAKRLPRTLWQSLLAATMDVNAIPLAAVDGTGFARSGPSQYYLKRIDRTEEVRRPLQMITMVDVKQSKFLTCACYAKPYHEAQRVPLLHSQSTLFPDVLLMDKA